MLESLTAVALAFGTLKAVCNSETGKKFVAQMIGTLAENFTEGNLKKAEELRQEIFLKLRDNSAAVKAFKEVNDTGSETALRKVADYLKEAMCEDDKFAQTVQRLTQEIHPTLMRFNDVSAKNVQQFNNETIAAPVQQSIPQKREQSQDRLLQDLEQEINGRLRQSLHNAVRLTLGMERRDDAVSLPWDMGWYRPQKQPEPLPAGTRVWEVFQQTDRQLLILGEPGSGKTTTMLELARDLLEKAKADSTQPIPVLVSLSSWKQPEVGIFEWLVAQLKAKYGLRQHLGNKWMQNRVLLPLLDGLDEVTPSLQSQCAAAINNWLRDLENRPCGILVCCRQEEFENIVRQKLDLQGAIYLQGLTPAQIEDYFLQLNLQDVWETLRDDAALQELLTKPLFLSMFGLVQLQGKFERAAWQAKATSEEKIEYLFDVYWDAVMSREFMELRLERHQQNLGWQSKTYKTKPLPERKAVRRMLVFVAQGMERDCDVGTELLIEKMQPSWLPKEGQKIIVSLIGGLIWIIIGGLIGCLIGIIAILNDS